MIVRACVHRFVAYVRFAIRCYTSNALTSNACILALFSTCCSCHFLLSRSALLALVSQIVILTYAHHQHRLFCGEINSDFRTGIACDRHHTANPIEHVDYMINVMICVQFGSFILPVRVWRNSCSVLSVISPNVYQKRRIRQTSWILA